MNQPFFTIGHSNHGVAEFAALLQASEVRRVVDIRTIPRSRANPQFNEDRLPGELTPYGIGYQRLAALGGLRGKSRVLPPATNGFWTHQSFHNYADYAWTPAFHEGLAQLIRDGQRERCAFMCAETLWWRCHRRIVTDYLLMRGETVFHIMGNGRVEPARLTPGAVLEPDGNLAYPAAAL